MTSMRRARASIATSVVAAALGAAALAVWLSGGAAGRAATATQTQGVSAAVVSTISWGSAGTCVQNMPTAAFGTLAAGASNTLTGFTGCVTSNATWSVATRMSTPLTSADDGSTINGSAIKLANTVAPPGSVNKCPALTPCTLAASTSTDTSILTGAPKAQNTFSYSLTLTVPATGASGGTYTDGTLTFTASN